MKKIITRVAAGMTAFAFLLGFIALPSSVNAASGTWGVISSSLGELDFTDVAMSNDGKYLAATVWVDSVYTSSDYGKTWVERSSIGEGGWAGITISDDGSKLAVVDSPGKVHTSTDHGATWTERTSLNMRYWNKIAGSADGNTLIIGADASGSMGGVAVSKDAGATWETLETGDYNYVAVSDDGSHLAYNDQMAGEIVISTDSGDTWDTARSTTAVVGGLDLSADGSKIAVLEGNEAKVADTNELDWDEATVTQTMFDLAMDATGQNLVVASAGDYGIYTSEDFGATWTPGEMTDGLDLRGITIKGNGERAIASGGQSLRSNQDTPEDFNGDGIADDDQPNVSGYISSYSGKKVAIDVGEDCELAVDDSTSEASLGLSDLDYDFESGLFEYEADCAQGATTTIKLYYYDTSSDGAVARKFSPRLNKYFNLDSTHGLTIEDEEIDGQSVAVVTFDITDGGELDDDQTENGTIVDPVGLSTLASASELADTGDNTIQIIGIAMSILLTASLVAQTKRIYTSK